MPLTVREIFPTLQGEGSRTGSPAIFVRLTGCNLWSGREDGRARGKGDCAAWCDTDFFSGEAMSGPELASKVLALAKAEGMNRPLVVFTGGEPLLQMGSPQKETEIRSLLSTLLQAGAETALETNGTRPMPRWLAPYWKHVTVSPKGLRSKPGSIEHLQAMAATDLKIVVPCPMSIPDLLDVYRGGLVFFQPRDDGAVPTLNPGANLALARGLAALYGGRVSIQTHKLLGLP